MKVTIEEAYQTAITRLTWDGQARAVREAMLMEVEEVRWRLNCIPMPEHIAGQVMVALDEFTIRIEALGEKGGD